MDRPITNPQFDLGNGEITRIGRLYLLNRLAFLLLGNLFLYRWYHFGLTVLALGLMAWLAWRARKVDVADLRGYLGPILQGAAWFAVLVLAIAATSNMFGNLTLAEMLTSGLIDSGYMALVVYAGITVFIALLGQLLPKPDGRGLRVLRTHAPQILHVASRAAALAGALGWLFYTANRFRIYRPIHDTVERIVTASIQVGEIELSLGSLLVFVLGLVLAVAVARLVRFLLREQVLPTMSLPRGVDNSIASLTYYALLFVGLLAALAAAGFQIGQLTFLFGAMGVGIGLGLQDVVKNFVSGLILMFERPVQAQDWLFNCRGTLLSDALKHKVPGRNLVLVTHSECMDQLEQSLHVATDTAFGYGASLFIDVPSPDAQPTMLGYIETGDWDRVLPMVVAGLHRGLETSNF